MDTKRNIPEQRCGESCDLCNHPMDELVPFTVDDYERMLKSQTAAATHSSRVVVLSTAPKLLTAR